MTDGIYQDFAENHELYHTCNYFFFKKRGMEPRTRCNPLIIHRLHVPRIGGTVAEWSGTGRNGDSYGILLNCCRITR